MTVTEFKKLFVIRVDTFQQICKHESEIVLPKIFSRITISNLSKTIDILEFFALAESDGSESLTSTQSLSNGSLKQLCFHPIHRFSAAETESAQSQAHTALKNGLNKPEKTTSHTNLPVCPRRSAHLQLPFCSSKIASTSNEIEQPTSTE